MKNRIGLLGGTFNPIHNGHIQLGLEVREAFQLDKILYILSAHPPHKKSADIVEAKLRWEMTRRALLPYERLKPCDIEMQRNDPSWTFQTIGSLQKKSPDQVFYFISGSEGFLKIRTWKQYRDLLFSVFFIVVFRKESHRKKIENLLEQEKIPLCLNPGEKLDLPTVFVYSYQSETLDLSSTTIRKRIRDRKSVEGYIPDVVNTFIQERHLYGY